MNSGHIVGIDVGGTFTDCVLITDDGSVLTDKSFTTPENPAQGMLNALANVTGTHDDLSVEGVLSGSRVVAIGTTSLTNKFITRGGARVGLLTTKGHEDAIFIGRIIAKTEGLSEADKNDYLQWGKPAPIVARRLVRGITERIDYKGAVIVELDREQVARVVGELVALGVEAIAVSLLWSFVNPAHELWIQSYIEERYPDVYVAAGSIVAPVLGEYERGNSALVSAYLGGLARREITAMKALLAAHGLSEPFLVMQSNGGCMWDDEVASHPLNLLTSGPAGGIIGSAKLGALMGHANIIATDMGGTSFDVGIISDGNALLSDVAVHDRIRMALSHVELVSIGAGGGSIAWVDPASGTLNVGPRSAGSVPGPIAYDQGGTEPTVTDADIVLGRIDPARFFNGRRALNRAKAEEAIKTKIADPLGYDVLAAAKGIVDIVDSRMGDLIRKLTIDRGIDPRDFVIFAYGGAGPTHVGAYAREAGSSLAVVSPYAAVFSALGIAAADVVRVYSTSRLLRPPFDMDQINVVFDEIEARADTDLRKGGPTGETVLSRSLEMRFRHQVHQVKIPVARKRLGTDDIENAMRRFVATYEQSFGQGTAVPGATIEIGTFHVVASTRRTTLSIKELPVGGKDASAAVIGKRQVYFDRGLVETPIYDHGKLASGNVIVGPAIVEGANTTLPLHPGQEIVVDGKGNLLLHFSEEP